MGPAGGDEGTACKSALVLLHLRIVYAVSDLSWHMEASSAFNSLPPPPSFLTDH